MSETYSKLDLLKKLKIPDGSGGTRYVESLVDFWDAAQLSDDEFKLFFTTILSSLSDVVPLGGTDEEKEKYLSSMQYALDDILDTVQSRRVNRNRILNADPTHPSAETPFSVGVALSRGISQKFSDAHTTIGPIFIDPDIEVSSVNIVEDYKVQALRTLRGRTDPVLKTHKTNIYMEVTLQYPQHLIEDEININSNVIRYGLRTLLATLKVAPICEISSTAILPVYVNGVIAPDVLKDIRDAAVKEVGIKKDLEKRRVDIEEALRSGNYRDQLDNFKDYMGRLNPLLDWIGSTPEEKDAETIALQFPEKSERIKEPTNNGISVACAFEGAVVSTSSEKTNHIEVKLVFSRFNEKVWQGGKILYRDEKGNKTPNVTECPWIERLARMTLLNPANDSGRNFMYNYHVPEDGDPGVSFKWRDTNTREEIIYTPNKDNFVLESASARIFMKMAKINLMGSPYPVAQYLGVDNVHAQLTFSITDPLELAKIHEMKSDLDRTNYDSGPPEYREHVLTVGNNLINMLGATDFVISSISTHQNNKEDIWEVQMDLVESTLTPQDAEEIILQGSQNNLPDDAKAIWDHIYDLLSETALPTYITYDPNDPDRIFRPTLEEYRQYKVKNPGTNADISSSYLDSEGEVAYDLVFGGGESFNSIINPNIMAAAWFSLTQKKDTSPTDKRVYVKWDTGWRNDGAVGAVMEGKIFEDGFVKSIFTNSRNNIGESYQLSGQDTWVLRGLAPRNNGLFGVTAFAIRGPYVPRSILDPSPYTTEAREDEITQGMFDWLSKGRYELTEGITWSDVADLVSFGKPGVKEEIFRFTGDTARRNLLEQGAEVLAKLGGVWRKEVFFTKEFWDEYFNIVINGEVEADSARHPAWTKEDIEIARNNILSLVQMGIYEYFPSLRDKYEFRSFDDSLEGIRVSDNKERPGDYKRQASNYADLSLPTYSAMFSINGNLMTVSDSSLTDTGLEKPLWKKFSPTYSDLGKKPPYTRMLNFENLEDAVSLPARRVNDPVDPGFFYYHERLKPEAMASAMQIKNNIVTNLSKIREDTLIVPARVSDVGGDTGAGGAISGWLKRQYKEKGDNKGNQEKLHLLTGEKKPSGNQVVPKVLYLISEEGQPLGTVTKSSDRTIPIKFNEFEVGQQYKIFNAAGRDIFEPYDPDHIYKTHLDIVGRTPDLSLNMIKLFPAYRLYFIEEDKGKVWMADDLYGVNSVISMSIRTDKWDAALLTAEISNVTHNLSEERILPKRERKHRGILPDDASEPFYSRLKLQSGVKVQVRLGYGSLYSDLPIVFTGMITEVTPGKVVRIVAQGHKRELLNEVQFISKGINHLDIILKALEKSEVPNLGREISARDIGTAMAGALLPVGVNPSQYVGAFDRIFNRQFTSAGRNVFINSNAPLESGRRVIFDPGRPIFTWSDTLNIVSLGPVFQSTDSTGRLVEARNRFIRNQSEDFFRWTGADLWGLIPYLYGQPSQDGGNWSSWVIPPQSCWEAIWEIARHRPGHIAQVVPFETEGTLFVGQPEQPYQAERPGPSEEIAYTKLGSLARNKFGFEFFEEILSGYLNDETLWYKVYKSHGQIRYDPALLKDPAVYRGESIRDYNITGGGSLRPLSKSRDSALFLFKDDIFELDELPTSDNRSEVYNLFGKEKNVFDAYMSLVIKERPADFKITDWFVYADDMTHVVDYIDQINPAIMKFLFYWYYDIEPSIGDASVGVDLRLLHNIFMSPDSLIFKQTVKDLKDPNGPMAVAYERLSISMNPSRSSSQVVGSAIEEIQLLQDRGRINSQTAERLKKDLNPSTSNLYKTRAFRPDKGYEVIKEYANQSLGEVVYRSGGGFRLFVYYLYRHLTESPSNNINRERVSSIVERMRLYDLPPGYRVFRSHHIITGKDIVQNNIYASMSEMANSILVRAPASNIATKTVDIPGSNDQETILQHEDTDWRSYPTSDGIPFNPRIGKKNRKLGVVYETNAVNADQKAKTMMSNMGLFLQPMYRGSLIVIGRNIKPYDVVYIDDPENDIRGHFEVASVTHHFSADLGWISDIEPHALVRVNNPTAEIQLAGMQSFLRDISGVVDAMEVGLGILTVAGLLFGGVGGVAAQGLGQLIKKGTTVLGSQLIKTASERLIVAAGRSYAAANTAGAEIVATHGFISHLGKFFGGVGSAAFLGGAVGLYHLGDVVNSLYVKHVVSSVSLPVDLHVLLYRGQPLQAGLDLEEENMYSIYEKFLGLAGDIEEEFKEFINETADEIFGDGGSPNPVERFVREKNETK